MHNARVDVFNRDFRPVSTPKEFRDPKIPAGYAPFNVQLLGGRVYVSYGRQNKAKNDVVAGAGLGFVDVYTVNGGLIKHLAAHGPLNQPWGLALGPKGFGPFGGDLLVGNLGNGWINAFNPVTGKYLGALDGTNGHPLAISGLWGLMVGNSQFGGSSSLVFSAGPNGQTNGLVGELNPAPRSGGGGWYPLGPGAPQAPRAPRAAGSRHAADLPKKWLAGPSPISNAVVQNRCARML